jgi:hypothetical protein
MRRSGRSRALRDASLQRPAPASIRSRRPGGHLLLVRKRSWSTADSGDGDLRALEAMDP